MENPNKDDHDDEQLELQLGFVLLSSLTRQVHTRHSEVCRVNPIE